jgi:hypothetical protein
MPLLDDILNESTATSAAWLASIVPPNLNSVPCGRNDWVATATQRNLVQLMGATYGCHTCNNFIAATPQNFIVDHIPPRGFFARPRAPGITYLFYPHCDQCAVTQAGLVSGASGAVRAAMQAWSGTVAGTAALRVWLAANGYGPFQIRLLTGGAGPTIPGHGGIPTAANRLAVNSLPGPISCHSCGQNQASFIYHADHNPPVEFALTSWFPTLIDALPRPNPLADGIAVALGNPFFRPQCPSCSHQQGGRCQRLAAEAAKLMSTLDRTPSSRGRPTKRVRYTE